MKKTDWSGFDKLQRKIEKLDGEHDIPFHELFNTSFMTLHTQHTTIDEFFKAGDFDFESNDEFENIPEKKLDYYVQASTNFNSWREMLNKAGELWMARELGF